jgi:hypothetical protein
VRFGRLPLALLACCLSLAAGCATASTTPPASAGVGQPDTPAATGRPVSPTPPASSAPPAGVNVAAFNALARQEASAWVRSPLASAWRTGLVVLSADALSSGPSGGFPSDEDKEAFINGDLVFTGPPPSGAPAGTVTWADGSTMRVPVLSEARVFSALTSSRECPGCVTTPLAVTAARPVTLDVATSRGRASVPAWAFTLKGVQTPVIEAALPPGSYATPYSYGSPAERLGPVGSAFVGATYARTSADGRTLTLDLPASPCDATWGGLVAETGGVVVIGGWVHDPDPDEPCAAMLVTRTATVRLAAPLGSRLVLDAATGQPVTPVSDFTAESPH